jgi:futalosine hydrolase
LRPYGIIVPTLLEAEILIRGVAEREEVIIQGKPFHKGVLKNRPVVICICGIGKTNAAHGATLLIERFQPTFISVIGVAGAYASSGLAIGDIVIGEKEIYGDEGLLLETGLQTLNTIGLPAAVIGTVRYFNEFPLHVPEELRGHRHKGAFVTISACTGTLKRGREIETKFGALCENMEGAAVAHVCLLNNVPAAEIRGISNVIADRAEKPLDRSAIIEAANRVQMFFLEKVL